MEEKDRIREKFLQMKDRGDVARLLGIKESSLRYFLYAIRPDNMYSEFEIRKRNGGERQICSPDDRLKKLQRKLLKSLKCVYKVKPSAYGFIEGRDIVQNASLHCNQKLILNIDLKDFFQQIHFGRVKGMFTHKPYEIGDEAAMVIAQLVCYQGYLPQGAPTSPIVSNMICAPLDTQLTRLAKKYHLIYSRYADDITFSTHKTSFPESIVKKDNQDVQIGGELLEIIKLNSFEVNKGKIYVRTQKERQEVTGLTVNKFVNLNRRYLKNLRAILDCYEKKGILEAVERYVEKENGNEYIKNLINKARTEKDQDAIEKCKIELEKWFKLVLKGKIVFIRAVRGKENGYYLKYAKKLNQLFHEDVFKIIDRSDWEEQSKRWCYVIESTDNAVQGSAFALEKYGIMTNYHVTKDNAKFYYIKTVDGEKKLFISDREKVISESEVIDYVLYKTSEEDIDGWKLGNSKDLNIGDYVRLIGFPIYNEGDTSNVSEGKITGKKKYMGSEVLTVSCKIVHGASGGVVLNQKNEVIGVIRVGANTFEEKYDDETLPSIIPINDIVNDISSRSGNN